MRVKKEDCQNFNQAVSLEWLETNGRGGFASGTVAGANTRRYHALLLVARNPPVERFALVNHTEEWIEVAGRSFPLSTNVYSGITHPEGYRRCTSFSSNPWPTWTYEDEGLTIQREILCPRGRDMVIMRWRLLKGASQSMRLRVRPMLTGRDYHAMHHENGSLLVQALVAGNNVTWQPYADLPAIHAFHTGEYRHAPDWYRCVHYSVERQRGLDDQEDWWSPGELVFSLTLGLPSSLVLTSESDQSVDGQALAQEEQRRRKRAVSQAPREDVLGQALWRATESYLSEREKQQTVIAGYPWFADWGRDTFISLPGLCLVTGRFDVAWQVIETFSAQVSDGMLPNRFPDGGEQPEYNTIDASLWFIHAVDRYLTYSMDDARVRQSAWPAIMQILDGYRRGTRYGVRMDQDGLIAGGVAGLQLTWMDAKVGDWVVTPRHGKPVEIQALWIHALSVGEDLATRFGDAAYAVRCREDRTHAVASFRARFWYDAGGYLYDVIDGPEGDDKSLRPNQLYAVALVDGLLSKDRAKRVVQAVEEHLVTAVGVRTLAPLDPQYRPRYEGSVVDRDGAYHQGTVWPFLLGVFVTAWIKTHGKTAASKKKGRAFLAGLQQHVSDACLGQVSEIFDAEPPHIPRGCPAQAWSVAEPLRALIEDLGVKAAILKGSRKAARPRRISAKRSLSIRKRKQR
jgi:predicted glycogen debranching enzyme